VVPSALILAGGSGTRFWPLSRRDRPKQLLRLDADVSLLEETIARLDPLVPRERVWISTTAALAPRIVETLPGFPEERLLVEPAPRNTAPAIAWAVARLPEQAREQPVAVLPSDHRIADAAAFRAALSLACDSAARDGRILTLGVVPRWAETGYGYLELESAERSGGIERVVRFLEKPERTAAERFVASGRHLWNAGMFVFRGTTLLAAVARHAPAIAAGLERIAAAPARERELFDELPAISIDFAVMEKLDELWTVPLDCGWDDLGSWQALYEVLAHDAAGNLVRGEAVAVDARDNLLFADAGTIAVLGVEGLAVVRTGDAVLVLPRERAQEVRDVVDALRRAGRDELL